MSVLAGDLVVIVNKDNNNAVDKALVVKIYTGATKNWPDGSPILAIDQSEESPIREEFNAGILGKTIANMKALWAQNIFTGKALPPKIANPDLEVKKIVSANKNAIGYIKASSVDDTVKVVVK
ncbi:MAG: substrate-binding domain-containing protein [Nitrospirae bacterium]|nr:substrate-binding domain-containing protein [Nitrospirota bacterium]